MKKLLLICVLFFCAQAAQAYPVNEIIVKSQADLTHYQLLSPNLVKDYLSPTEADGQVVTNVDQLHCLNPKTFDKSRFARLYSNLEDSEFTIYSKVRSITMSGDSAHLECSLFLNYGKDINDMMYISTYDINKKIDMSQAKQSDYLASIRDTTSVISDLTPIELAPLTLSSALAAVFTLDNTILDPMLSASSQKVSFTSSSDVFDELLKTKLTTVYYFMVNAQNEINIVIWFIFSIFLLYLLFFISKIVFDKKSRHEVRTKVYLGVVFSGLIMFAPYPSPNGFLTTNAAKLMSSTVLTFNGFIDKLGFRVLESVLNNNFNSAGIKQAHQLKKIAIELSDANVHFKILDQLESNCLEAYPLINKSGLYASPSTEHYKFENCDDLTKEQKANRVGFNGGADWTCNLSLFGNELSYIENTETNRNACRDIVYKTKPALDSKIQKLTAELNTNNAIQDSYIVARKLKEKLYAEYSQDGWISLIWSVPKIMILGSEITRDPSAWTKIKDEIDKATDKDLGFEWMFRKVPLLTVPGANTILSANQSTFSSIPFLGSMVGTSLGLSSAVLYSEYFLAQLPVYIWIMLFSIVVALYYITLLIYVLTSYFILSAAVLSKNMEVVSKFLLSFFVVLITPLKIIFAMLLTWSTTDFIQSFVSSRAVTFESDVRELNSLNGGISMLDSAGLALFSGVLTLISSLLVAFISFWIITKMQSIIMQSLSINAGSISDAIESISQKISQKKA
ncbi:MAG: hypothetical protein Q7S59_06920 [Sulfurimonas sp.]|nr:hypothetical protein [Sulfurimonas sp.]